MATDRYTTDATTLFDGPGSRAVMTYNIKNGWNGDHWIERRDALASVIRAELPLLVGTQEGFLFQLKELRECLPGYDFVGSGRFADRTDEHCAILYDTERVTILDSGTYWLAHTPDSPGSIVDGENLPRVATWARCRVASHDRDIVMVNTHLTYQDIGLQVQTARLVEGIDRIVDPSLDVILTGDFNQNRRTPTWETITSAGFVDLLDIANAVEGPIFTFPDWDQWSDERAAGVEVENRIDWILYRPGTGQPLPYDVRIRTINTHTGDNPPSDHFPVVASNASGQ
jgi:endonuclease/exonuclease/phosphatase family metal-dependent hydrolase